MAPLLIILAIALFLLSVLVNLILILSTLPARDHTIEFLRSRISFAWDEGYKHGYQSKVETGGFSAPVDEEDPPPTTVEGGITE